MAVLSKNDKKGTLYTAFDSIKNNFKYFLKNY